MQPHVSRFTIKRDHSNLQGPFISFEPMVAWAIGRRPYIQERTGEILMRTHQSIQGARLQCNAHLHQHLRNGTAFSGPIDSRVPNGGRLFPDGPVSRNFLHQRHRAHTFKYEWMRIHAMSRVNDRSPPHPLGGLNCNDGPTRHVLS